MEKFRNFKILFTLIFKHILQLRKYSVIFGTYKSFKHFWTYNFSDNCRA